MTKFQDGPAKDKVLALRSSPKFLRVVVGPKGVDALDQEEDIPANDERIYAYRLVECLGTCHIKTSKGGGFYSIASYKYIQPQPKDEVMRSLGWWREYCNSQ